MAQAVHDFRSRTVAAFIANAKLLETTPQSDPC